MAGRETVADTYWVELIRSEYNEMPDLHLTPPQMQRLWGIGADTCRAVIEELTRQQALKLTLAGGYARLRNTD